MAGGTAELAIVIKARDDASRVLGDIERKTGGLGKALGDVGKIASGFVIGQGIMQAPGFLFDAAQAAADDAASIAKLQLAVENSGAVWETYRGQLEGVVEMAMKRGFTDDEARDALALLTAQTGDAAEAAKRFAMAQDLARGANIDVYTASKLLGKVTDENVQVLARYGIKVKEGAGEAELFGAIQQKFGGQAEVFAKSTAGQMAAAKIQMGELKEELGYALMPIITQATRLLVDKVIPAIRDFLPRAIAAVKDAWAKAQPFVDTFKIGLETLGEAAKALFEFITSHKETTIAAIIAIGAAVAIAFGPASLAVAAIAGIILAVGFLSDHWDDIKAKTLEVWNAISDFLDEKLGWMKGIIETAWQTIHTVAVYYWETIKNYFVTWWSVLKGIFDFAQAILKGDWQAAWDALKGIVTDVWHGIKTQIETTLGLIKGMFAGFPAYLLGLAGDWLGAAAGLGKAIVDGIVSGLGGIADKIGDVASAFINAIKGAWNAMVDWADANFKLHISIPFAPDIDFDPDLSWAKLARGGIVTRPTLALLGERGPEAVIPLSNRTSIGHQGNTYYGPVTVVVEGSQGNIMTELERMLR